ncbi:MAG TPA: glycine cleavage system protein GcvH [Burkholderiales bacterium]|jgi:glycine cleavage system H protein|nr:glycine cleavage system protein GcvH [Burkholderiales bacterium]
MKVPETLRYTETHEWVRAEPDGTLAVGITDFAQDNLGELVYVETPDAGRSLKGGESCAVVESVKAAADVYAPVAGEVVARNAALADAPSEVNKDCYGAWLFKIRPAAGVKLDALMDAAAYRKAFGIA